MRKFSGKKEIFQKKGESFSLLAKNGSNFSPKSLEARVAIYDSLLAPPRTLDLQAKNSLEFIGDLSQQTYQSAREMGGEIPFSVIREIIENLIHAHFREAVITILDQGKTIRISDLGPGIKEKGKALQPGFSTATQEVKKQIRGVGSGLPIVKETISYLGGSLTIENNLEKGTVVTLSLNKKGVTLPREETKEDRLKPPPQKGTDLALSDKRKRVLLLLSEVGPAGPSAIARELKVSISAVFRDLTYLEKVKLIQSNSGGKRALTKEGMDYLEQMFIVGA